VTRQSGVNPAWIWRICHANVTRKFRVRCASCSPRMCTSCKWMLLLDPYVCNGGLVSENLVNMGAAIRDLIFSTYIVVSPI
jgi:hypothetical protein